MKKVIALTVFGLLFTVSLAHAQLGTTSPTGTLTVNVTPEMALVINNAAVTFTQTGFNFSDYTATVGYTYFIRTTGGSGTGTITAQVTSDFAGAGTTKPSVASPPTTGDVLSYVSTVSGPGTLASGNAAMTATNIATFGAEAHSLKAGNSGSLAWTLSNDPLYSVGSYIATITYTINAL